MNIQSGQTRTVRSQRGESQIRLLPKMWAMAKIAMFLVLFALILNGNIFLRQKIATTEREIRNTERRINSTRRELEQLRADYAEYTRWRHISRQIAIFKLPLTSPRPGQVRSLTLYTSEQSARIAAGLELQTQHADSRPVRPR